MPEIVLPTPREHQAPKIEHPARHKLLVCGRRWGKTQLGIHCAVVGHGPNRIHRGALDGAHVWIVDQNNKSAYTLWCALKGTVRPATVHISEVHRRILLMGGGSISVKSAERPDSLVGDVSGLDGVVMNEGAKFEQEVWTKAIRPSLSDRLGWSVWPSTPEGLNYFFKLYEQADEPEKNGQWARWQEPSFANKFWHPSEIEDSRKEGSSELEIRQEYYAEFVTHGTGRAYFEFSRANHVPAQPAEENRDLPLDLCVSFACAPPALVATQTILDSRGKPSREVVLCEIATSPGDPSTREMLSEFRRQFPHHSFGQNVRVFGEVSGRSSGYSDFEAMRAGLPRAKFYDRSGTEEKDRTNSINLILRDGAGRVRATINPSCENTLRDLEGVRTAGDTFALNNKTLGLHVAAWGAKVSYLYPALLETLRARQEDRGSWGRSARPEDNPEAKKAHDAYWSAVRSVPPKIIRPDRCDDCGKIGGVEAHHKSYARDQWLVVDHLCPSCHRRRPAAGGTISRSR